MKDKKILLVIMLLMMLMLFVIVILCDNYNTRKANEKLKKEKYEIKLKCKRLEEEKLQIILKN